MCKNKSSTHSHQYLRRPENGNRNQHCQPSTASELPISSKERLIIRLQNVIRNNKDYAGSLLTLAAQSAHLGAHDTALLIMFAKESAERQCQDLEKALALLEL